MKDLIEKLAQAEGPSRELDAEIAAAVHTDIDGMAFEAFAEPDGKVTIYFPSKVKQAYAAPRYTASIDAALTLVPEGWETAVYLGGPTTCVQMETEAMRQAPLFEPIESQHKQSAIALCIAALSAKEPNE